MEEDKGRIPRQIVVIGTNGTGKTTLVKKLVIAELKKKDSHVLIVVPDDMEWPSVPFVHPRFPERIERYVGARKIIYEPGILEIISDRFKCGMLVFDDCRAYFDAGLDRDLHTLLIRRRQKMLDIVAVGHGFTEIPPKFFTFATDLILFRTIDNIDRRKNVLNNFDEMKVAQGRINQKAAQDPHYYEVLKAS